MSTRGLWGFRKNGKDKLIYNHSDSYPSGLGTRFLHFVADATANGENYLPKVYDSLVPEDDDTEETRGTEKLPLYGLYGFGELRKAAVVPGKKIKFFPYDSFIKNSLFCEWAYVANLDTEEFEIWKGFQKEPCERNRYGKKRVDGYFPCRKISSIYFSEISPIMADVFMRNIEDANI